LTIEIVYIYLYQANELTTPLEVTMTNQYSSGELKR